eukprot:156872-Hanusia_phi.AAC.1
MLDKGTAEEAVYAPLKFVIEIVDFARMSIFGDIVTSTALLEPVNGQFCLVSIRTNFGVKI